MRKYQELISYYQISRYQFLTEEYMRDYDRWLDWELISKYQKMSLTFMEEYSDQLNWTLVCQNNIIPIDFLDRIIPISYLGRKQAYVSWETISEKELTLEQIRHYHKYLNWDSISKLQDLTEEIITEFRERVNWDMLYRYNHTNLSYEFIKKNVYKFNKDLILNGYGKFSQKETRELKRLVNFKHLFANN
jgi:hypothetical protein